MDSAALLRRIERTAILLCGVMAVIALALARGAVWPAISVVGGGILIGLAYASLKSGVAELMASLVPGSAAPPRKHRAKTLLAIVSRYALLALLAYVMIARLRMHPLALLAGVSSFVAAVSVEAVRLLVNKP